MSATVVTFPQGAVTGEGTVVRVQQDAGGTVVMLDATPFHPVDHTWPDQPGDAGVLRAASGGAGGSDATDGDRQGDARSVVVTEAVMAATDADGALFVASDIPVKRGTDGWTWLVAHRIDGSAPAWLAPGAAVVAEVDAARRAGLSRGHTACHLASLALDLALADLWRKDPGGDALGTPDFEGQANQTSRINPDGAVDEYRLGKSLRKAGFDSEGFAASLAEREARINKLLAGWVATRGAVEVAVEGPTIVDRRRWECELPEGRASIPCGGTHASSLGDFASITAALDLSDPQLLVMTTRAVPASDAR